jgi:hypothetical protein
MLSIIFALFVGFLIGLIVEIRQNSVYNLKEDVRRHLEQEIEVNKQQIQYLEVYLGIKMDYPTPSYKKCKY